MKKRARLVVFASLCFGAMSAGATRYEYDALNRLTRVTYDNGFSISYTYDAAGNITAVTSEGRCTAALPGILDARGDSDRYSFEGLSGEPITLRLEAVPKEAGVGRFARLMLLDKSVSSALPTELTAVLPRAGGFVVQVKHPVDDDDRERDSYAGPYQLTLEASPVACATFGRRSKGD